ncbi:MAG: hypothetical protein WAJ91_04435 [Rhodoplanes sp.]
MASCRTCGVSWRAAQLLLCVVLALLLPLAPGSAGAQQAKLETAYVVLGADGAIARAVASGAAECPSIDLFISPKGKPRFKCALTPTSARCD